MRYSRAAHPDQPGGNLLAGEAAHPANAKCLGPSLRTAEERAGTDGYAGVRTGASRLTGGLWGAAGFAGSLSGSCRLGFRALARLGSPCGPGGLRGQLRGVVEAVPGMV